MSCEQSHKVASLFVPPYMTCPSQISLMTKKSDNKESRVVVWLNHAALPLNRCRQH